jgi:MOSC domain-containing protein YiiM
MVSRTKKKRDIGPLVGNQLKLEQILKGLESVLEDSPLDGGVLHGIVIRPSENKRESLQSVRLSPEGGLEGDRWALGCWRKTDEGRPHPDVQVSIMNSRYMDLIAHCEENWPIAGDNLYADLNLSQEYLEEGQLLRIGSAVLQITAEPHMACRKFALRFGMDAARVVNTKMGRFLRLRGVYARVVIPGIISVGDRFDKITRDPRLKA